MKCADMQTNKSRPRVSAQPLSDHSDHGVEQPMRPRVGGAAGAGAQDVVLRAQALDNDGVTKPLVTGELEVVLRAELG